MLSQRIFFEMQNKAHEPKQIQQLLTQRENINE